MKRIISLLVENHQGVLVRIAGLFSGRGYNLESLAVGVTTDPTISRVTLVTSGDERIIEQIKKQLNKLIDVIKVIDLTAVPSIHRELVLIKVKAAPSERREIVEMADIFGGTIADVGQDTISVELSAQPDRIGDFLALLQPYTVVEIARSGLVSIEAGQK